MQRRSLVTGATGFLGSAMVEALVAQGFAVRAAVRGDAPDLPAACEICDVGNIHGSTDWTDAVDGVDCVIHIAGRAHVLKETDANPLALFRAVNRDATLALANAAEAAGVRRMIFISSIGVNGGETHGRGFRASDPVAPHSDYAIAKWEAEQGLAEIAKSAKMEMVVIRPPLILGRDPKGNLATLNRVIDKGLPLPFGMVRRNRRDFVSRGNLVDLIMTVIDHPAAAGGTFLASDGAPISTRVLIEHLGRLRGRAVRLLPVPPVLLSLALLALGRKNMASQLLGDLEVDIGHTRDILGWSPRPMGEVEN